MSNARLKQLKKDNNIKPPKIPSPLQPKILSVKEDPRLLKQIFIELKDRDDIVEIVVFKYTPINRKKQNRVPLKQCDYFNIRIFYV